MLKHSLVGPLTMEVVISNVLFWEKGKLEVCWRFFIVVNEILELCAEMEIIYRHVSRDLNEAPDHLERGVTIDALWVVNNDYIMMCP